jgi:hypothetical protein
MFVESKMKSHAIVLLITVMLARSLVLDTALAQAPSGGGPSKDVRITGCLVRGDEPGEVWLAQKDGEIYGLESGEIALNAHLGQKVVVMGYVLPEAKEEVGEEAHKKNRNGKRESADFHVRTLKLISKSCTQ